MNYSLGHDDARIIHTEIINNIANNYSLTITLNPYYRSYTCSLQYKSMLKELKEIFKNNAYYETLMFTCEYTQEMNCHFHCYFTTSNVIYFEQFFKQQIKNSKHIGKVYKLKKIDEISVELLEYPFKDIDKTLYLDKAISFNPKHYVFRQNGIYLKPEVTKPTGSISIAKFIEFIEKNKNI